MSDELPLSHPDSMTIESCYVEKSANLDLFESGHIISSLFEINDVLFVGVLMGEWLQI
jgi:hypothetical protein